MLVPLLIIVGYLVKHYTTIPTMYIPYLEIVSGLVIGIVYGLTCGEGWHSIFMYGGQGVVLGAVSISLYDAIHGTACHIHNKNNNIVEDICMEEKKKFKPFEHSSVVYGCAFLGTVIVSGLIELVFHGVDGALVWVRDYAHYGLLYCVAVDVVSKASKDKTSLVWQYWVLVGLILMVDISYVCASITTTFFAMWVCLVVMCTLIVGACLWCNKMYKPAVAKKADSVIEKVREDLGSLVAPNRVDEVINYFIERK